MNKFGAINSLLFQVVDRIAAPTFAHKKMRCPRTPRPVNPILLREPPIPLSSGLPRSKNVKEIVARLYSANKFRYKAPAATQITLYM